MPSVVQVPAKQIAVAPHRLQRDCLSRLLSIRSLACLFAMAIVSASCSTPTQAELQSEMAALVQVGDEIDHARAVLRVNKFECSRSTEFLSCSRTNQHVIPPYTCIERIYVRISEAGRVTSIESGPPACAGL